MLTTTALHDGDLDRALGELADNASRLAVAGLAQTAHEALALLLLRQGPWRMPAHGALVQRLQRLLPGVCLLAGQACPRIGDQAAMSAAQLSAWAEEAAQEQLRSLARVGRNQLRPAGTDWSPAFLATLAERRGKPSDDRPHTAFGAFCVDAEFVLKSRLAERFGCSTAVVDVPSAADLEALGLPAAEIASLLEQLQGAGRIEIAAPAAATSTLDIVRAIAQYLQTTGFGGGYLDPIFAAGWLLLVDEAQDQAALEVVRAWLHQDEHACARMIDFAPVPSVRGYLQGGSLAPVLQLDAQAARDWLAQLRSRRAPQPPKARAPSPSAAAVQAPEAFLASLQGTALQALHWLQVPVPGGSEFAWAASIPVADRKRLWQEARALVERLGRWPLVTTLWSTPDAAPDVNQLSDELFSRWPYAQGPARDDISPQSFIATSRSIEVDAVLAALAGGGSPSDDESTLAEQGAADGVADPERGRQPPFEPGNAWLLLLPMPHGEDALAYVHWYGIERGSADGFIRLLRAWRERHGAELFAHYGTMLEFEVQRPPADMDTALQLAREHERAAPCTLALPGIPLRHYALGLIGHAEWFLHERP
jgi:Domain of unknown function (DUF4253)